MVINKANVGWNVLLIEKSVEKLLEYKTLGK